MEFVWGYFLFCQKFWFFPVLNFEIMKLYVDLPFFKQRRIISNTRKDLIGRLRRRWRLPVKRLKKGSNAFIALCNRTSENQKQIWCHLKPNSRIYQSCKCQQIPPPPLKDGLRAFCPFTPSENKLYTLQTDHRSVTRKRADINPLNLSLKWIILDWPGTNWFSQFQIIKILIYQVIHKMEILNK